MNENLSYLQYVPFRQGCFLCLLYLISLYLIGDQMRNVFFIKGLAVLAVVILHVSATLVLGLSIQEQRGAWITANIFDSLVRWAVPLFVIVSGYLLLDPKKTESKSVFYLKRMKKIFVPLIFWTFLYQMILFSKNLYLNEEINILEDFFKPILYGKPFYHLWYLYMITGLYFLTPYIRTLILKLSINKILYLTIILFIISILLYNVLRFKNYELMFFLLWIYYLPFYLTGYLLRYSLKTYTTIAFSMFLLSTILTIIITFYLSEKFGVEKSKGLFFYGYLSPTVVVASLSLAYVLFESSKVYIFENFISLLGKHSFGIYLIHPIFIILGVKVLQQPYGVISTCIFIIFLTSSVVFLSLITVKFLNRFQITKKII